MTTNPIIAAIGTCLSRGTIISIVLVLGVLPQILVLGDFIIEKTSFELKSKINLTPQSFTGATRVSGIIRGQVNGTVEGSFNGIIRGSMNATILSGEATSLEDNSSADTPPDEMAVADAGADTNTAADTAMTADADTDTDKDNEKGSASHE